MRVKVFPAKVVSVLDFGYKVVINRGADHGIKEGQRFLIYGIGEELYDPDTQELLGVLEEVKGKGKAVHVQNKMTTIESDQFSTERTIRKTTNSMGILLKPLNSEEETITPTRKQFENPVVGDLAKPI